MVAQPAAAQRALVREVVDAGMRLCDHSRTHDEQLPDRAEAKIDDEVLGAATTLSSLAGGAPVEWYRAPGGNWSPEIQELAATHGMQPLGWNVDPKDWERPGVDAIVTAVQRQLAEQDPDGAIVLLHDGGGTREETVQAVEQLIPWLAANGYRFGFPTG
jgi:peptidoglycan-N-acetylglucosamine deacetylase